MHHPQDLINVFILLGFIDSVKVIDAKSLATVQDLDIKDVIEIDFSPKGTFLSTWQRQSKYKIAELGLEQGTFAIFTLACAYRTPERRKTLTFYPFAWDLSQNRGWISQEHGHL